jgi:hypothetical protein
MHKGNSIWHEVKIQNKIRGLSPGAPHHVVPFLSFISIDGTFYVYAAVNNTIAHPMIQCSSVFFLFSKEAWS